ncbi:ribonuclease H-like domain-containing protein [Tanacetum coccineum]
MQKTILKQQYKNFTASRSEGLDKIYDSQSNSQQLDNEDLKQIDTNDLEEMDLKWYGGQCLHEVKKDPRLLNGPFVLGYSTSQSVQTLSQISVNNKTSIGFDNQMTENELHDIDKNNSKVCVSASDSSVYEIKEENNQVNDRFKKVKGYHTVPPLYTGNYMPSRPDLSFARLDDSIYKTNVSETITSVPRNESTASKSSKDNLEQPKDVRPSAPIIEEWESDSDDDCVIRPSFEQNKPSYAKINFIKSDENTRKSVIEQHTNRQAENLRKSQSPRVDKRNWNGLMTQKLGDGFEFNKKACFVCGSLNHLIKDCNFYENKMVGKSMLNNMGRVTGQREVRPVWNNAQRVNNVTTVGTKVVVSAIEGKRENVVKSSACWIWRPTGKVIDHISKDSGSYMPKRFDYGNPQYALQDQGIFDSGCSRHMTGNKSYLTDYQDIDGGFVAFAGSPKGGKITGKGKIRTGKLDFEDVYFVKELKFNLFSVSQMCDKKNSVLFTKTECLVLSPDFKLLDESQVLLKVPRQNNMYSFDLKNVVPLMKGIKREFSIARTPQRNGVAERKNKTLIEAARTMLADSLLSTTFWAEAINTVCYVQNTVLITKPHNKRPYELLIGRPPNLDFIRPFGCPVTILNTLDHLGKFKGKTDEGFLVGYSINSKAFRVFNTRTRKVEENLHIKFLENKSNVARSGPEWIFDIDSLTKSMNYEPVTARNQTNSDVDDKDTDEVPGKGDDDVNKVSGIDDQERTASSTQDVNTAGPSINTVNANVNTCSLNINTASPIPNDLSMPSLEETGIFDGTYDDEDVGAEADLNNLETTMNVSPIPITRIHKDHPKDQIIGDLNLATQTKRMINFSEENAMIRYSNKIEAIRGGVCVPTSCFQDPYYDEVFAPVARIEAIRFQVTPKTSHLHVVKRIFRYLKGQPKLGLWYPRDSPFDLESFSDSDYAGASLDRKSTTGGCQFLGKRLISWQCKKQTIVANYTTKAEYVVAANCYGQVLGIQNQMLDYGFNFMNTKIYINNESTIWYCEESSVSL